jgi:hypothetical protein
VQALPDAARALRDVRLGRSLAVDFEVGVAAVAEELAAARPEVGERRDELLRVALVVTLKRMVGISSLLVV